MLFIIMVRLVQCKLPADSSFSSIYSLWNCPLKSVGLFPERQRNCLWHTGQPSVLRFDCKQLTMPSTLGWRDDSSCGEDVVSSNPYGTRVPCFRNFPAAFSLWLSPGVSAQQEQIGVVAGASDLGGASLLEWFPVPQESSESWCRRALRCSSRQ